MRSHIGIFRGTQRRGQKVGLRALQGLRRCGRLAGFQGAPGSKLFVGHSAGSRCVEQCCRQLGGAHAVDGTPSDRQSFFGPRAAPEQTESGAQAARNWRPSGARAARERLPSRSRAEPSGCCITVDCARAALEHMPDGELVLARKLGARAIWSCSWCRSPGERGEGSARLFGGQAPGLRRRAVSRHVRCAFVSSRAHGAHRRLPSARAGAGAKSKRVGSLDFACMDGAPRLLQAVPFSGCGAGRSPTAVRAHRPHAYHQICRWRSRQASGPFVPNCGARLFAGSSG